MAVKKVTAATYDQATSAKAAVVDFYAQWCAPCGMLSPIVDKVSEEYTDVEFFKVDIDEDMSIADRYHVMSIPTLVFLKNGELAGQTVGFMDEAALKAELDKVFK